MRIANNILLKVLGILLLAGAVLKGWQLVTEPVANNDIWSYRPFLIFVVEFEIALAIWLLSGLFKKAAWLAAVSCFSLFSFITLYKGITGVESCGCFGSVHVNPWITLFTIDIPVVIVLAVFRPKLSFLQERYSIKNIVKEMLTPFPSMPRISTIFAIGIMLLVTTTTVLAFNKPAQTTFAYEVLEPETWVGEKLPILDYIDIGEKLKTGNWLILLYHYDCPDCVKAIPKYEQIARDLKGNEDFLKIAFVEVPPYGLNQSNYNSPCCLGKLAETKEWFVTTPAVALLKDGQVTSAWEAKAPGFDEIIKNTENFINISSTNFAIEGR